jgi:threonine dehydrogenase-like Zn-dependent dehydrogenase
MVTGQESLFLQPEATYPFVPGHELVGRVERAARGMRSGQQVEINPGDRVVVWPVLGCDAHESYPPCGYCVAGWDGLCSRRHSSAVSYGLSIGFDCATGGGWSEQCVAHVSQLWKLPDGVTEEDALLLDPASTALAALLNASSDQSTRTLIIGGGTIGLLTAWLHQWLRLGGECELLVRHEFQAAWAKERALNATVVRDERKFQEWAAFRSMAMTHVAGYGPVYQGHFDRAIDAAGTESSLRWALHSVRPRGLVTLVSTATYIRGVDLTPAWYRGLSIQGICAYGPVLWQGQWVHPYSVLIPRLAEGSLHLRDLITHQFPLREYVAAFHTAIARHRSGAIKVAFRPNGDKDLRE